jgi:hypothetical protein
VDDVINEPLGGAHNSEADAAEALKSGLVKHLEELKALSSPDRLKRRYEKFRAFGHFIEESQAKAVAVESGGGVKGPRVVKSAAKRPAKRKA